MVQQPPGVAAEAALPRGWQQIVALAAEQSLLQDHHGPQPPAVVINLECAENIGAVSRTYRLWTIGMLHSDTKQQDTVESVAQGSQSWEVMAVSHVLQDGTAPLGCWWPGHSR